MTTDTEPKAPAGPLPVVFDGHNDVLLRLYRSEDEADPARLFFERQPNGHIDMQRAEEGRFGGGFFAVYIPSDPADPPPPPDPDTDDEELPPPLGLVYSQRIAMGIMALLFQLERKSDERLKVVRTAGELQTCLQNGVTAAILHFEGAEPIDINLDALEVFYQAGLRSLGPVWSRPNPFAEGVPFRFPHSPDTGPGLTDAGLALVKACNSLGIMVDLSHLNEQGFWDVARTTTAPLVATHSNAHALCQATRNLTDKQLDAIRESDGMVGVNFAVSFLREDGKSNRDTPLEVILRHLDYLVERLGMDRVGFGSDFDGATMPSEIGDVAGLPKLLGALRAHGYSDTELRKLAHENWVRVLRKTWGK